MKKKSLIKKILIITVYLLVAAIGSGIAVFVSEFEELPDIRNLEKYRPILPAQVYDKDNNLIHEFAVEKRVLVTYKDIPKKVQDAIVAVEDANFWEHTGVYPIAIMRAFIKNIEAGKVVQGGSTITQQLATLLFLNREVSYRRKLNEALLAIQIEHNYSKEEILTLYCNQVFFGHGIYGIEAAANFYFNKHLKDLTLEEAALLAAIPKKAAEYSPILNPANAKKRRDYVLTRMAEEGFITNQEAKNAIAKPIKLAIRNNDIETAAYFIEEVRKQIEQRYGYEGLYTKGLKIYTTLDMNLQKIAERVLRRGLINLQKEKRWKNNLPHISLKDKKELYNVEFKEWKIKIEEQDILPAIVTDVTQQEIKLRIANYKTILTPEKWKWTRIKNGEQLLQVGDVALVSIDKIDEENKTIIASLEVEPEIEGAILTIEIGTGRIKAMVGGYSFRRSKFNRATQAYRQAGSSIKPLIYAAAFEKGFKAADLVEDAPITFIDPATHKIWSPQNYTGDFLGIMTLRRALELSRNTPSVRILNKIGIDKLIEIAKRANIRSPIQPYLSSALGASDVTLLELAAAYTSFANQGIYVKPYYIEKIVDIDGNTIEEYHPFLSEVMSAETAYQITSVLEGVILRGTAVKAKSLNRKLAGKTGTTDDYTDGWFIGYNTSLLTGVWVGYDEKKPLGNKWIGSKVALPIWMDFMKEAIANLPDEDFYPPSDIILIPIDRFTGLRASPQCPSVIIEAFVKGTEPTEFCSSEKHIAKPKIEQEEETAID